MAPLIFLLASAALQPLQLETDPVGWDSLRTVFARDTKYHAVTLSITSDLTFVKQAAEYIKLVYEGGTDAQGRPVAAQGVEGLVTLTVFEQNPNELQPEELYRGQLDFTTYSVSETGVTVRFKETGFATSLLTRDQSTVDLLGNESLSGMALPSYEPVIVGLHSQQTLQRYEATQPTTPASASTVVISDTDTVSGATGGSVLLRIGFPNETIDEFGVSGGFGPYIGDLFSPLNVPFYTAKESGDFTFEFAFADEMQAGPFAFAYYTVDLKYQFRVVHVAGAETFTTLSTFHEEVTARLIFRHTTTVGAQTFTATLAPGDKVYLEAEYYLHGFSDIAGSISGYSIPVSSRIRSGAYFRMRSITTTAATTCPGLLLHEAFARCVEACTDQRDSFYSEYFGRTDCRVPYSVDGAGAHRLITSGFQLRGFPLPSAVAPAAGQTDVRKSIATALRDLYDSADATDCLGMGLEQRTGRPVVRVEPRAYFYQSAEVLRLGRVTELKKTVYPELLYNEAQVGYAHWQSGAPNGLDEFNALRTYSLPLTQLKKTYSAVSKTNAAGYLLEEARRDRFAEGATKEGKADAELFFVCLRKVGTDYVSARSEGYVTGSIGGILSPSTAYNLPLSPGRMLRAHGPWLRAGLSAQVTKRLLPGKAEGNAHLVSQKIGEAAPLDEFPPVAVSDLPAPLVLAETYEFTVRLRRGQMLALTKNPYGRVSFVDSMGNRKAGYLLRAERTPQGGRTTFTLLRAAS